MEDAPFYKRVTLLVADIDRSLTIYRDILGFTVDWINDSSKDSYSYPAFKLPTHAKVRFCAMNSPNQHRTLGFTEVKGMELPRPVIPHMSTSVIKVNNIKATMDKIKYLGLDYTDIVEDKTRDGAVFYQQTFTDYDGHLIFLYEHKEA